MESPPPSRRPSQLSSLFVPRYVLILSVVGGAPLLILFSPLANASDDHFPSLPSLPAPPPFPASTAAGRAFAAGDDTGAGAAQGDNFMLVLDDVSHLEETVLDADVIGEPLSYQDNAIGA